MVFSKYKWT